MSATLIGAYEKQVAEILRELGIGEIHGKRQPFHEATELVSMGRDIYEREQKLAPNAAASWHKMKTAAERDGITLLIVSAFRSVAYQRQIIERKLVAGQKIEQILRVSAAPGYSEHHTGRAIDITTYGCKPLTEEFEQTLAFTWLVRCAKDFDFTMTYPRNNKFGVIYEPWHWTFHTSN
jgi:D-alanyl-D-alanine carboxypeptidase